MSRQGLEGTTGRNNDNVAPHTHKHIQSFHLSESTWKTPRVLCHFLLLVAQKNPKKPTTQNSLLCRNIPAGDEMAAIWTNVGLRGVKNRPLHVLPNISTVQIHFDRLRNTCSRSRESIHTELSHTPRLTFTPGCTARTLVGKKGKIPSRGFLHVGQQRPRTRQLRFSL